MYGPAAVNTTLHTLPDLSSKTKLYYSKVNVYNFMTRDPFFLSDSVVVDSNIINSNQISVTWMTPQLIANQGVSVYRISVTPLCSTGGVPQTFIATPSDPSSITLSGLGELNILYYMLLMQYI